MLRSRFENRVAVSLSGPFGSGKTSALAAIVGEMVDDGAIDLHEIAAFAPTRQAIRRLRAMIGAHWPDVTQPQSELFARELSGTPTDALVGHTALVHDDESLRLDRVAREYRDVLRRLNRLTDDPRDVAFLNGLTPRIDAALRFDIERRKRGEALPPSVYLHGVADFLRDYKARHGALDIADLLNGDYYVSKQIRLLLLDEVSDEDRDTVVRFFPNASIVTTSVDERPADVALHLPRCLRAPDRWDVVDHSASPFLIPPPDDFASLFILTNPWRRAVWLRWLREHGLPQPDSTAWRAMVAAYRLDRDESVSAWDVNPLLMRAGLPREEGWIDRDEIDGWPGWREIGAADPYIRDHLDAVQAREPDPAHWPTIRINVAANVRHDEADAVIFDCAAGRPSSNELIDLALTRATKRLIVLQGETASRRLPGGCDD